MENQQKYIVCIHCMTYNHEPYILDALHGFAMQQTSFPYVALVMDDASTDGEPEVLRQYIAEQCDTSSMTTKDDELYELVEINAKDNPNCHFAFYFLKQNLYGTGKKKPLIDEWDAKVKYIAMCEGDDYWTDPLKLQKQVDFLESHPEYSMCFHGAEIKNEAGTKVITTCDEIEDKEYFTNDIFPGWVIPTASVVYRKSMLDQFPPLKHSEWMKYGDIVLFLKCMHTGRVWGMSDKMSVYRMTESGAVVSQRNDNKTEEKKCKHYQCLMENFPQLDHKWPNGFIATHYYTQFRQQSGLGNKMQNLWIAIKHNPSYVIKKLLRMKVSGVY